MSDTPSTLKYLEIYETLRNDILMKVYPNNTLLPTESQMMETYGVGRNTVRRALKQLQNEGFITTQRGSGSLVCYNSLSENFLSGAVKWHSSHAEVEYYIPIEKIQTSPYVIDKVAAPPEVAKAMHLDPETIIFRNQRLWLINGIPYNYMIQYVNPEIMPDFDNRFKASYFKGTTADLLERFYGLEQLRATEHITCCNAGFVEANLLNVEPGTALEYTCRLEECVKGIFVYAIFYGNPKYTGYKVVIEGKEELGQIPNIQADESAH